MSTRRKGQPARTRYRVIERAGNRAAWVELQPLTGRTHQLRVHMAAIGHPIVGDGKYGGPGRLPDRRDQPQAAPPRAAAAGSTIPTAAGSTSPPSCPSISPRAMASLGFDPALGDLPLDEVKFSETAEGKRKAASRRRQGPPQGAPGERRSRRRG